MWATTRAAASTALSACLYWLDLGTTISAIITYYHYEYDCPHAPLPSALLRDPVCRAIRVSNSIYALPYAFWGSLFCLALAHLTCAFMFWLTLDRRQHPLRLAYFMPLIHLYCLFKLLRHSFTSNGLKQLQKNQEESSSLYNALGASVETVPQFILQFHIVLKLGWFLQGSSSTDPATQIQTIPTNLVLSLVASMVSSSYSASMAIWLLMRKQHVSLARRVCLSTTAGCQTFVGMLVKAMFFTAFLVLYETSKFFATIYMLLGVIVAWPFIGLLLRSHCDSQGRSKFLVAVHSLGFALMTTFTGPIYVMVKLGESTRHWIWGTLLHILVELIGLVTLVISFPSECRLWNSPPHSSQITSTQEVENKYLTCKVFLATSLPSLFVLLLTSILFAWVHVKNSKIARDASRAPKDIVCHTQLSETFEDKISQQRRSIQMSVYDFETLLLLVLVTVFFVQKLLEGNTRSCKNH